MPTQSELAASIRSRSAIKDPESEFFLSSGPKAALTIRGHLKKYLKADASVLDFGCASGRVLIPMAKLEHAWCFNGCDVDAEAVEYIRLCNLPNVTTQVNGYAPPSPFDDGSFDAIYALSVWSHFPEDTADEWITEMHRLLRKGGVALITTAGPSLLRFIQKTFARWGDVTDEQIAREGFLYRELGDLNIEGHYPGISSSWGNTIITKEYMAKKWGGRLQIAEHVPQGMNGQQDLTIFRRG